jgi:glycosyltransferase involved in cell wall biosynthesis
MDETGNLVGPHPSESATCAKPMKAMVPESADGNVATGVDLSVVIPVYNEEDCLPELHRRLTAVMNSIRRPYEIIFVDDGSADGSLSLIQRFSRADPHTRYLSLTRNFGQAAAVAAGQGASRGRGVIMLDSDLQNPPEEIPRLLAKFDEGYELVYGIRKDRKDPFIRRACSSLLARLLRYAMSVPVQPSLTAFTMIHRRFVDELNRCLERTRFYPVLCAWLGAKTARVEVRHERRFQGSSKYNYWRLFKTALDLLTSYTRLPLRLAGWGGLLFCAAGMGTGCWAVFDKLANGAPLSGSAGMLSIVGLIAGIQLLAIGAVGAYVGRAYTQLLGRPLYVVRETDHAQEEPLVSPPAYAKADRSDVFPAAGESLHPTSTANVSPQTSDPLPLGGE